MSVLQNLRKLAAAGFAEIKLLENPRWRPRYQTCCETAVAIAIVLN